MPVLLFFLMNVAAFDVPSKRRPSRPGKKQAIKTETASNSIVPFCIFYRKFKVFPKKNALLCTKFII